MDLMYSPLRVIFGLLVIEAGVCVSFVDSSFGFIVVFLWWGLVLVLLLLLRLDWFDGVCFGWFGCVAFCCLLFWLLV